ncbi:MAG TPA: TetR family transcriptional regulator [Lachnospiraceae bacterium]|nr:TetR/AcrR family transcriptional regulator [uncultured Lachnoclostridium sp.]HAU87958.1 TetR family transcriptional regulator [Lachnospiraceae bacterium]
MGKVERKKKEKKDALLNTAFELFTTKGIHKTSIADIVEKAGVAKGTFYLYFSDKYDIRNKLISHKASQLFHSAKEAMQEETDLTDVSDRVIFIVDHILNQLTENKVLLNFISKNLSWGVFKSSIISKNDALDINLFNVYNALIEDSGHNFENAEIMLYMIIELVGSTCYSPILYNEPTSIEEFKPFLYQTIRHILEAHRLD